MLPTVRVPEHVAIVAPGPSLRMEDLDKLYTYGVFSYGVNRIFKIYDQTDWRPDIVSETDWSQNPDVYQDITDYLDDGVWVLTVSGVLAHLNSQERLLQWHEFPKLIIYQRCIHVGEIVPIEWHLPHPCGYGGSTFMAIQHAVLGGAKIIDLYGCDFHYEPGQDAHNHVVDDYCPDVSYPKHQAIARNEMLARAWRLAQVACKNAGIQIERLNV